MFLFQKVARHGIKNQQKQNRKNQAQLKLLFQNFPQHVQSVQTMWNVPSYALFSVDLTIQLPS